MKWARVARGALVVVIIAAIWESLGQWELVAGGALPPPSDIVRQFWADRSDYPPHLSVTLKSAGLGFVFGNIVAIVVGVMSARWRVAESLFRGVGVSLFAMPLIAIVPVLLLAFSGTIPRIVLAAMAVYYPTYVATVVGMRSVDPRLVDVVRVAGGEEYAVTRWIRWRSAVPHVVNAFKVSAPAALLGTLLVEFGGGSRWGLGTYLLGSLGQANPARLWGIGLAATIVAALAYALFAVIAHRLTRTSLSATVDTAVAQTEVRSWLRRILMVVLSAGCVLGLWALTLALLGMSPIVAKSPLAVVQYLTTDSRAATTRDRLLDAYRETLPLALLGLVCGLAAALILAVILQLKPTLGRSVLPFALISQTMPLPALTPLIVLIFGRDVLATVVVCVSVTFFPSFVTISQALVTVSPAAVDVVSVSGGARISALRYVGLPGSVPALATAARLAAPRALLGVMIAEYLATGNGLGNLLNESRGRLDYGMIWTVATTSVVVAVLITQVIGVVERLARRSPRSI
jgi:ABC-type nitrate/sulfonate/bicarbonate transport system permease component